MKKELNRFERVAEGAYFAVDIRVFESTLTSYDPILANQTLLTTQEKVDRIEADKSEGIGDSIPLNT
jgi:hypothetical protein